MIVGAIHGIKHEIEGYIFDLRKETTDLHVILTGGDTSFFDSMVKATIFVRPELILTGLNRILLHNETNA
jgi:type III pantothenate kinase